MLKKALKISSFILFFSTISIIIGLYVYKVSVKNQKLSKQLKIYEDQDRRLENMQRTLLVCYGITPYEAKYYSHIFLDFSQKYEIPWEAFPALVRIESNFNSGVMSKDRAKGMTQVLESTGKIQAGKLNIPFNEGTLWNCVLNMVIGFDYFSEGFVEKLPEMSRDSALRHAMKRYCGGPGYAKSNPEARIYVKEYKMTLWDEYKRVNYVYKGIMYDQLIAQQDSVTETFIPFKKFADLFEKNKGLAQNQSKLLLVLD